MIIRELHPTERAAVRGLLTGAFADDGRVADLAEALSARPEDVGAPLVAEVAGAVVGYTQLSRGWIDADRQLVEALVLSPLAVAPAHQRRGIGRALSDAAVDRARRLDAPAVFLEGDPNYYAKLGWQPAGAHGVTAPSVRIGAAGFQVVLLPAWQSWMAGAFVYNDTFWSLDCVGLRD